MHQQWEIYWVMWIHMGQKFDPKLTAFHPKLTAILFSPVSGALGLPSKEGQSHRDSCVNWFWELWCVGWWLSHICCYFFSYSSGLPSTNLWRPVLQSSADAFFWVSFSMMAESIEGFKMVQVTLPLRTKTHILFHTQTQPCSFCGVLPLRSIEAAHTKAENSWSKKKNKTSNLKPISCSTSNQNVQAVKLSFLCLCHSHASFTVAANAFRISLRGIRQNTLTCDTGNQVLQTPEFSDWSVGTLWVLHRCAFCRWLSYMEPICYHHNLS